MFGEEDMNFIMEEPNYEDTEIEFKGDEIYGFGFSPIIWFNFKIYIIYFYLAL